MRIFIHILRTLVALVFIYSGISKIFPLEPFELFLYEQGFFNFIFSTIIARLLIGTELIIGLILLINIFTDKLLKAAIALLILFTGFLGYLAVFRDGISNCNCFGDHLPFTPFESIIKNLILILMLFFLLYKNNPFHFRFKYIVAIIAVIACMSIPFVLSPPDYFVTSKIESFDKYTFNYQTIGGSCFQGKYPDIKHGKKILCFFSPKCKFCKLSARKMSIISDKNNYESGIYYLFFGEEEQLDGFWEESKSKQFPYKIIPPDSFFKISGYNLPAILFIEDSLVVNKVSYRDLFDNDVIDFFDSK